MKEEVLKILNKEYQDWAIDFRKRFPNVKLEQCTIYHILRRIIQNVDNLSI